MTTPTEQRQRRRTRRVVLAAFLALLAIAASVAPASAQEADAEREPAPLEPPILVTGVDPDLAAFEENEALMAREVAEQYAAEFDISFEDAQRRLAREAALADEVVRLLDTEGDRVAGYGLDHQQAGLTGFVWLTGDAPATADGTAIADALPDLEIRYGATYSLIELEQARETLLSDTTKGLTEDTRESLTYSDIDMEANAVEIGVAPGTRRLIDDDRQLHALSAVEGDSQAESVDLATTNMWVSVGVPVNVVEVAVTEPDDDQLTVAGNEALEPESDPTARDALVAANQRPVRGGEKMNFSNGYCTSAFTVRQRGDVGVLTAGHCLNRMSINRVTLDAVRVKVNARVDAQWHSPAGRARPEDPARFEATYRCRGLFTCKVEAVQRGRAAMMNRTICHNGARSGHSCGRVTSVSYRPAYPWCSSEGCAPIWIKFEGPNLKVCNGDSGGPVYDSANVAFGVLSGSGYRGNPARCGTAETTFGIANSIAEVERQLGVRVRTWDETNTRRLDFTHLTRPVFPCGADRGRSRTRLIGFEPGEPLYIDYDWDDSNITDPERRLLAIARSGNGIYSDRITNCPRSGTYRVTVTITGGFNGGQIRLRYSVTAPDNGRRGGPAPSVLTNSPALSEE